MKLLSYIDRFSYRLRENYSLLARDSFFTRVNLFFVFFLVYFQILFIIYFILQDKSQFNDSFRLSIQSFQNFGKEPTSYALFLSLIVFLVLLFLSIHLIESQLSAKIRIRLANLVFPSIFLICTTYLKIIFDFETLLGPNGLLLFQLFLLNTIFILAPLLIFLSRDLQDSKIYELLGFIYPSTIVLLYFDLIPNIFDIFLFPSKSFKFFISLILIFSSIAIVFVLLIKMSVKARKYTIFLYFYIFIFLMFYSNKTQFVISFRPSLSLIELNQFRYNIFIVAASLLTISIIYYLFKWSKNLLIGAGSIFFTLPTGIDKLAIPNLDTFHQGEYTGLWFNTKSLNLIPYKEVEYPRGLFVNYLPSEIANILSPGNPEATGLWMIFISVILKLLLTFYLSDWIPAKYALILVFLLPLPNNYVEIDYICWLVVLFMIKRFNRANHASNYLIIFTAIPILILSFPGQGLLTSAILVVISVLYKYGHKREPIKFQSVHYIFITFIVIFYIICIEPIFYAIKWVLRNSISNSQSFGDSWFFKLLDESFPTNLRWTVLILLPSIVLFSLLKYNKINFQEKILTCVSLIYLIPISGRWFGRTDFEIQSRIGLGGLTFVVLIFIPLVWRILFRFHKTLLLLIMLTVVVSSAPFRPLHGIPETKQFTKATIAGTMDNVDLVGLSTEYKGASLTLKHISESHSTLMNLTGGSALDYYLNIPSIGGIQSPYLIVNLEQEKEWIERIQDPSPDLIYGPFGSLGGIKADSVTIGSRAPLFLKWIMDHYEIMKCNNLFVGLREDLSQNLPQICSKPINSQQELDFWSQMDGNLTDVGNSIISWSSSVKNLNMKSKKVSERLIYIKCHKTSGKRRILLEGKSQNNEVISQYFEGNLRAGILMFDSSIFPISNLTMDKLKVTIPNSDCGLVER